MSGHPVTGADKWLDDAGSSEAASTEAASHLATGGSFPIDFGQETEPARAARVQEGDRAARELRDVELTKPTTLRPA